MVPKTNPYFKVIHARVQSSLYHLLAAEEDSSILCGPSVASELLCQSIHVTLV